MAPLSYRWGAIVNLDDMGLRVDDIRQRMVEDCLQLKKMSEDINS